MGDVSLLQQELNQLRDELSHERREKHEALSKVEILQLEVENAKESEKKMLESLTSQTRQLEQIMISLEEAKLEIKYFNESIRPTDTAENLLRAKLNQALRAEEKSKKAMDDLAVVLKEVTTESNNAKKSYFQSQSELEKLKAEAKRLRSESEESSAIWSEKENSFLNCIRNLEEEIVYTKKESMRLIDSQRLARIEISKLRDIVKQAVNESTIVKEALEIARNENSQLKDLLLEKEDVFMSLKKDFERRLKVSDPTTSSLEASKSKSTFFDDGKEEGMIVKKSMMKFPSENWRSTSWNTMRDQSRESIFDTFEPSPEKEEPNQKNWGSGDSPSRQKKKRQALYKFGDMLRMRSFNK